MISKVRAALDKTLGWVLILLTGLSIINVLWQVASRYLLQSPSSFTEELARYLLIWIGLLGGAYVAGKRQHLAIDLIPDKTKGKSRRAIYILIDFIILAFAVGVLLFGGARLVWMTLYLNQVSAAMGLPLGYVYLAAPISGAFMAVYAIMNIISGPPPSREQVAEAVEASELGEDAVPSQR